MPQVTTPTGENLFIARALKATDGAADLAILCARFVEMLHARPGLDGAWIEANESGTDFALRHDNGKADVSVTPQIDNSRLEVSLYGTAAEHAAWHGQSCLLRFTPKRTRSWARTYITTDGELDDLASHIDQAGALRQIPLRDRRAA